MRLILSPAKKMRVDTDSFPCLGLPRFLPRTREILAALRALSPKELQALCLDIQVLDEHGNQIELKDEDEDTYQPGRFKEDYDRYQDYGSESDFAQAGFTMKETSDDDDLSVAINENDTADQDDSYGDED